MQEVFEIKKFLKENLKIRSLVRTRTTKLRNICPFRNEQEKKCDIYKVRPIICKLYGVSQGNFMKCVHGNTHQIDGLKFLKDHNPKTDQVLNFIKW